MLPFGVNIPATVPQRSEIPEGLMNYPVCVTTTWHCFWSSKCVMKEVRTTQFGGAECQWKEKERLIECGKNVIEMCVN